MATAGDNQVKPDHVIIWCDRNMGADENNKASKAVLHKNADLNGPPSSSYSSWIDDCICSINPYLNEEKCEELIKSPLRMFIEEKECLKCIHDSIQAKKRVFLIISGEKGALIVPEIHKILSGFIYIFCGRRDLHESWTGPYEKDIEIYDDEKGVFVKVLLDIGVYYLRKGQDTTDNPSGATQYFYWAQRLIVRASRIDHLDRGDYLDCIQEELSDLQASRSDGYDSDVWVSQAAEDKMTKQGASIWTKVFKLNINILIALLTPILPATTMIEYDNVEITTFDDDCACISQLLSIKDKLIYLVVPVSLGDFVVPLIHDHICIECIYLYQDSHSEDSIDWMNDYSKVRDSRSSIDRLVELIKEDIDSVMKCDSRWSRSQALYAELGANTTSIGLPASSNEVLEDDISTLRIVILYLNRRRPFCLVDKKIIIDEFYDIDKCINSLKDNTSTTVFLIISMNTFNDIRFVFELDAVHAVYIATDLELNEQIQKISTYSKLSGIFAYDEDLLAQLTTDIRFYRTIRAHTPILSVFKIEFNVLEKLTEHQIDFLFFQLFSDILSQLPTQSTSGVGSDLKSIDWQVSCWVEANMTVCTLLKQFNTSTLHGSVSKLNEINKHIMSLSQNVDLSSATVYRVQIVSKNDLNMLRSNSNTLLAIHSFILASHSFKSIAKICRLAVENQLTVVLFELKLLDKASVALLDSYTVVFSLGTLFRLEYIDLAPDGVWRAQLEVANGYMERIKDQLQIEIGIQLTWFTFGNYLTTFKRLDAAEKYYEYLLLVLPPDHPSLASIYNNIGLMHSEMNNDKEALKWFDQSLDFNIKEFPMQIEGKDLPITNLKPPQFSSNDRILTLAKMAEINYHQGELKKSLDCYRQGLQIADNASWRQFFQAKVVALLSSIPDSET